jgi:hypothetical protein
VPLVEPRDLTVEIPREIREDLRGLRQDNLAMREDDRALREDFQQFARHATARFEVIETALRDLTQQLVLLARGLRVTLDRQPEVDQRLDDLERRVSHLEGRTAG